ncbi:hypothetical protein CBR_g50953 [Chara braunii]|uniref:Uncharacterized protein n=1 Tax=Chara braunii TaxID=69332 RepID=A0A388M815_CHABU|nr:hypothetical protein CBR_g50953 [Chara braunii]|eukprot:GBG90609.1 hypothetical protein CBR_g50953 [Chara braunii]
MDIDGEVRRDGLTTVERTAVAVTVNVVPFGCQMASSEGKFKAAVRARHKLSVLPTSGQCLDVGAISDAVLQVCYAMGCGAFPWATPRWWMKRRTGGTWEDLRQCDDATDDYCKDKLRMSPRVFREIAETLSPLLQRRVTFYRVPLQPDHVIAYALYRWAAGQNTTAGRVASALAGLPASRRCGTSLRHCLLHTPIRYPGPQAQVVVDMNLRVLDVFVGYLRSVHDMRMLNLSSLWARAEEGQLFTGPPVMLPFGVRTNGYLLGDND